MTPAAVATATEIARAVRAGRSTARTEVAAALERIRRTDPGIGAFQVVRRDRALMEADAVDRRPDLANLALAGVPIAVKDNVAIEGEPMRAGSLATSPLAQPHSHVVVELLRAAGAVVVGITRMPELGVFASTDSAFGLTRNPLDPARSPGGSSGGSAAAVAGGLVPIAHGNDGLGSVRIPAACCGIVGVKPGRDRVPSMLGGRSWLGMAENGALATTVADAALLLSVLAGDPTLAHPQLHTPLRVAVSVPAPLPLTPVDASYRRAATLAGQLLADTGHTVQQRRLRVPLRAGLAALSRWFAGTALEARAAEDRSRLATRTARHARLGEVVLGTGGPRDTGRQLWDERVRRFFLDHDVLITPGLAQPPKPAVRWSERSWAANVISDARYAPFAAPWNLAGCPAAAIPIPGVRTPYGPTAVQLVVPPGHEGRLLAVAAEIESAAAG